MLCGRVNLTNNEILYSGFRKCSYLIYFYCKFNSKKRKKLNTIIFILTKKKCVAVYISVSLIRMGFMRQINTVTERKRMDLNNCFFPMKVLECA